MDIKKVDDKPMVIHTKKKFGLHIKSAPGAKARGRAGKEQETEEATRKEGQISGKQAKLVSYRKEKAGKGGADQKKTSATEVSAAKYSVAKAAVSVAAESALDETEGGSEVYHAYMVADTLAKTAANAASAGRNLYRSQAVREKQKRIKQQQSGSLLGEKESSQKLARKKAQAAAKKAAKETGKKTARETMQAAEKAAEKAAVKTAAAAVGTGAASIPGGIVAGELVGIAMDRREVKSFTRNRMARLSMEKLQQGEGQDSIGKALKDIIQKRVSMAAKYTLRYGSILLLALAVVVAVIALVVIAFLAIIYNSPLAVFFPSISSGETVQEVLSAYVSEFQDAVDRELADHAGYDTSEKIYVNFEGVGTPDNYYDILMVYMVKHGNGDTATDMTDQAKQNLKIIFDDMCSYTVTGRTDTGTDDAGHAATVTVKEVNVELKSCYDMVPVYGFQEEEQEMLAELMKPESLAMLGYTGGGGDPGEGISKEQYQAVLDAVSDENGRKVVAFALSKVGYPYSQTYRDSGEYYDCSSLAYYAWQSAGVSIMYEGSNTAASEGKLCYDRNLLVDYDTMQPGDLIFYSYDKNKRFMDITHVAIYVGDGKVVEAANSQIGVVYRPVQNKSSIVFIGRPR